MREKIGKDLGRGMSLEVSGQRSSSVLQKSTYLCITGVVGKKVIEGKKSSRAKATSGPADLPGSSISLPTTVSPKATAVVSCWSQISSLVTLGVKEDQSTG